MYGLCSESICVPFHVFNLGVQYVEFWELVQSAGISQITAGSKAKIP